MARRNDLSGIKPIKTSVAVGEKRRKQVEFVLGIALLVVIVAGGILLYSRNKQTQARVAGASTSSEVDALRAEIDNLNKKIDEVNQNIDAARSVVVETETTQVAADNSSADSGASVSSQVNINTASLDELDSLPGIGPTYAQRIIDYRKAQGSFRSTDELQNVKGIGPKTFEKLKDLVTI